MKKSILSLFSLLMMGNLALSQSIVSHWNFNSILNDATTSTGELTPALGSGTISAIGGISQAFATGYSTDSNTTDNSGCQTSSYPSAGTNSRTAGLQMDISTIGFNRVALEFYQRLSNSAANTWVLQYTLDNTGVSTGGNVVWTDATVYTLTPAATGTGDTWHFRSYDFGAISGLGNNATAGFRIVSDFDPITGDYLAAKLGNTYSTAGTSRFDLVTLRESYGTASIVAASNYQVVSESAGSATIPVTFANANNAEAKVLVSLSTYSSTTNDADLSFSDTLIIPALTNGIVNITANIIQDSDAERAETAIIKITPLTNTLVSATDNYHILYIKDDDYIAPIATNEIKLSLLTSFSNGPSGTNSAEIVAHDPTVAHLYVANSIGAKLDIVDFSNPSAPQLLTSVPMAAYGNINSVTAHNGYIALALESIPSQNNGSVVILDANGNFVSQVTVGAMPDMITFSNDHTKLFTANEGEPSAAYSTDPLLNADLTVDPKGSVSIVDLSAGYASLTNANVTTITFDEFNGQETALKAQGIRIFSSASSVSQDVEPEYIAVSDDDSKLYVTLQENNALAIIDVATAAIDSLVPLGYADYSSGNGMDASDQTTGQILITSVPVKGAYMPDAIKYANIGGNGYVLTANEGDSREFGTVVDAARINSLTLDSTAFPDQHILKNNRLLGRLSALKFSEDTDNDGDLDELHAMGSRSYSIWDASTGALVFDSKDLIERILSQTTPFASVFNASNSTGAPSLKNRSDDKGPEPEGITHAVFNNHHYLFVSLERIGGVMIFNVDNPVDPQYVGYANNRSTTSSGPDLGPEGIVFIDAENSPTGAPLLLLANEISSTLSVFAVQTCIELAGASISADATTLCEGETATLQINGSAGNDVQWFQNNVAISNATLNNITVQTSGAYSLYVQSDLHACADTANPVQITVNPLPVVTPSVSDNAICYGDSILFQVSGADTYSWSNPEITEGFYYTPLVSAAFTVVGTDNNGCIGEGNIYVTVNTLPEVSANVSDNEICSGQNVLFYGSGAQSYTWNNGVSNGISTNTAQTGVYQVIGTDFNGCVDTAEISLTVNALPTVSLPGDTTVCIYNLPLQVEGPTGFAAYFWSNGTTTSNTDITYSGTFTLTATDQNGCTNSDAISVATDECLGMDQLTMNNLNVYPNPSKEVMYISSAFNGTVELLDLNGRVVLKENKESEILQLNVQYLSKGMYSLQLKGTHGSIIQPVIIE